MRPKAYLLCREGVQPLHGNLRGPVAPEFDERYPNGGHLARGASWCVELDAGSAFVVSIDGPDDYINDYVMQLPGAYASATLEELVAKLASADGDDVLATAVLTKALDRIHGDPTPKTVAMAIEVLPSGFAEEHLTDDEIKQRGLTP